MNKLLVVDDSELIRSRLVEMLRGLPGVDSVDTAENLSQTLDYVFDCPPALTILDLHLPDGNALQILEVLKRIAPAMQIVMLSNDANEFNRAKCLKAGADAFFDKSTEFESALAWAQRQAAGQTANPKSAH
jgi:DNA-binding NarL/FixJ family response regulator